MGMMDDPSQLREMCPYTTDDCKCLYCRTASEIETLRAELDKEHADRDKEIRHYSDKWKDMGAEIDSLRAELDAMRVKKGQFIEDRDRWQSRAEAAERDTLRVKWIQDECESLELEDWSDDVRDGRAWVVNDDWYHTDCLRDAIDAAIVGDRDFDLGEDGS